MFFLILSIPTIKMEFQYAIGLIATIALSNSMANRQNNLIVLTVKDYVPAKDVKKQ